MNGFTQLHVQTAGQLVTVPTIADLPTTGVIEGAIRYVESNDAIYTWDGANWGVVITGLTVDDLIVNTLVVHDFADINTLNVFDPSIVLNYTSSSGQNGGLIINRGSDPAAQLAWDETAERWKFGTVGDMRVIPQTASEVDFDNAGTAFSSTNVQSAIEEAALGNVNETTFIDTITLDSSGADFILEPSISAIIRDIDSSREEIFIGAVTINSSGEFEIGPASSARLTA